jgi:hypothetical protein
MIEPAAPPTPPQLTTTTKPNSPPLRPSTQWHTLRRIRDERENFHAYSSYGLVLAAEKRDRADFFFFLNFWVVAV